MSEARSRIKVTDLGRSPHQFNVTPPLKKGDVISTDPLTAHDMVASGAAKYTKHEPTHPACKE